MKHIGLLMIPVLDPNATRVLQILLERSNIAGYELMSLAGDLSIDKLMSAIAVLRKNDLIQVVGNSSTKKDFEFSRFAVPPTAKTLAGLLARQAP